MPAETYSSGEGFPSIVEIRTLCHAVGIKPDDKSLDGMKMIFDAVGPADEVVYEADEVVQALQRFRDESMTIVDTVQMHTKRMDNMLHFLVQAIAATFHGFNFPLAHYIVTNHDLSEGMSILRDIPTPIKNALSGPMKTLLQRFENACLRLIAHIPVSSELGDKNGTFSLAAVRNRQHMWNLYTHKKRPWAQIVKYLDLLDAFMMSLLEYQDYDNGAFGPISERYRGYFERIATGEDLPAIRRMFENRPTIDARLAENFDIGSPTHTHFSQIMCLFDLPDLRNPRPKALDYWKREFLDPQIQYTGTPGEFTD